MIFKRPSLMATHHLILDSVLTSCLLDTSCWLAKRAAHMHSFQKNVLKMAGGQVLLLIRHPIKFQVTLFSLTVMYSLRVRILWRRSITMMTTHASADAQIRAATESASVKMLMTDRDSLANRKERQRK